MSTNPADSTIMDALYGTDEMRAVFADDAWLQHMLDFEAALARAEVTVGLLPPAAAESITQAARVANLRKDYIAKATRKVGYPVTAIVAELGRVAGEQAARYVHLGATTQDVLDTSLVLQIRKALAYVRRDVVALAKALASRARVYRDTSMAGRTHMQHAVPITFGLKCANWAAPLVRHVERLDQAMPRCMVVQFGGAAGTLASLGEHGPAVVQALARELGLSVPAVPWHTARDGFAEIVSILAIICGSLSKFALDFTLLTQTEVAEVAEPHEAGRGGSSTMPQKRNPIACEYILAAARGVRALAPMMLDAMAQDHERATGPWQSESLAIPQSFVLTAGALARARSIAEGMTVDTERMRRNLQASGGLIMAESVTAGLAPMIGRQAAHELVTHACDDALRRGGTLRDALLADNEVVSRLSAAEIDKLLDPSSYLGSAGVFVDRIVARVAALE